MEFEMEGTLGKSPFVLPYVLQMASFEWKRKIGEKVSKAASQQFEAEAGDDKDLVDDDDVNWVHATKRRKEILLEDCVKKSS
uniref:Uncharacterized protein n=1 Tax=Accipiter nisus TaxID=211598 RepID=A0A8B9M574_9AVES